MDEIQYQLLKKTVCAKSWKRIGIYPHHGLILMLSAIHSKKSCGIGEFFDLIPLIKWSHQVGLDFIQLLPITDSGLDNSPYNPISTLALNPVFLSLHALPYVNENPKLALELRKCQAIKKTKFVEYHKVRDKKFAFLKKYYEFAGHKFLKKAAYKSFKSRNPWVIDYAIYNTLCEVHKNSIWLEWPTHHKNPTDATKRAIKEKHPDIFTFYVFIQYLCYSQMNEVRVVAEKEKVFLLGDLPFLVSKYSCDAWSFNKLFHLDISVGSPPDDLTPKGQHWHFPAYNWKELEKTDYGWWKLRLKVAEQYFHIYRLDHIIGFYRTWNIPKGKESSEGAFCPKDPAVWLNHGRKFLLALISNSHLLPIGEDLVIPQTIKDSMRDLGVCGTSILTWQRTGAGGLDFVPFPLYPCASITHLASHDTLTIEQWWRKMPAVAKQYSLWKSWKYSKVLDQKKRFELLYDSHHTASLFHANLLQEYLALFPELVHSDHNEERINYPGTPSKKNWRYRFIPSVEQIACSRKLFNALKKIIS